MEESKTEISTKELLERLSNDFKKCLDELDFEKAVKGYEKMRDEEWERISTIQID